MAATTERPPTPEQHAAIEAEGLVFVSAGAGTGKTSVLVERFVRAVCDRGLPIDGKTHRAADPDVVEGRDSSVHELEEGLGRGRDMELAGQPRSDACQAFGRDRIGVHVGKTCLDQ